MADTPLTNLDTVTSTDRTAAGSQPDFSTPTGTTGTGGGGGSPTGAAGGDLGGSYPNPKVLGLTANTVPLTYGPISPGQYLLRSGSTIIGGTPSGAGNVNGPASSLDNHVALFNGTSGTAIKDSGVTLTAGTGTPALTVNGTASVSGSNTGDQTDIDGNAGTASALNPGAKINTVTFTGAADITVYDATKLPLAGGTMSGNISMNGFVLTNLAAGTSANDSVRYSQIPTSLPPSGAASGDLSGNYPGPQVTLFRTNAATHTAFMGPISGSGLPAFRTLDSSDIPALPYVSSATVQAANKVLAGPITGASAAPTFRSLDKADIPATISSDTTGNAASATILKTTRTINTVGFNGSADITITDDTKLPLSGGTMTGPINMGAKKITNISNGSDSSDAAAFGQIPTTLPPNGAASGSLGGSYPNPTVTAINETSGPQKLTIGAISDGQVLKRSGSTLIGASVGTGDVTGPSSSIAGRVATFSTTSGKAIQDSGVSISDVVVQGGNATLSIADITQLKLTPQLAYPTGGPITFDLSVSRNRIPLTVNLTVSATSGRASNVSSVLELYNSTSGNLTITWSQINSWKVNGMLPTIIGPGQTMQFLFQCWGSNESDVSVQYVTPGTIQRFNVKDFGAKGDGSTDDSASIQACFNAACTSNRSAVYFPTATTGYKVLTAIKLNPSGPVYGGRIAVLGDGEYGTMIIAGTNSMHVFDFTLGAGYSGAEFRDLSFGTLTNITAGTAIRITNDSSSAPQVQIDGIYYENGAGYGYTNGITCDSVGASYFNNIYGVGGVRVSVVTAGVAATSLVNGRQYRIASVGSTDFTTVGSPNNNVGEVFTASGPATGSGTADYVKYTYDTGGAGSGAMIKLTGFCINNRFSNIAPLYWYKGISIGDGTGTWQGVEMTNVNTVFTPYGIDLIGNSVPDCGAIQMSNIEVDNGNVPDQSVSYGIRANIVSDIQLSNFFAIVNAVGTKVGIKLQNRSDVVLNNMRIESSSSANAIELNSMSNVIVTDLVQSGFTKAVNLDSGCHYCRVSRVITTGSFTPNITDSGTNNVCGDSAGIVSVLTVSGTPATQTFDVDISQANLPSKANGISGNVTSDPTVGMAYDWDDSGNSASNARIKLFKYNGGSLSAGPYRVSLTVNPNRS